MHAPNSASPTPTCARLDALSPGMTELGVDGITAFLEPSTAASATAEFVRLSDDSAHGAPAGAARHGGTGVARRACICGMRVLSDNR